MLFVHRSVVKRRGFSAAVMHMDALRTRCECSSRREEAPKESLGKNLSSRLPILKPACIAYVAITEYVA